jgi:hypothetical protein
MGTCRPWFYFIMIPVLDVWHTSTFFLARYAFFFCCLFSYEPMFFQKLTFTYSEPRTGSFLGARSIG